MTPKETYFKICALIQIAEQILIHEGVCFSFQEGSLMWDSEMKAIIHICTQRPLRESPLEMNGSLVSLQLLVTEGIARMKTCFQEIQIPEGLEDFLRQSTNTRLKKMNTDVDGLLKRVQHLKSLSS